MALFYDFGTAFPNFEVNAQTDKLSPSCNFVSRLRENMTQKHLKPKQIFLWWHSTKSYKLTCLAYAYGRGENFSLVILSRTRTKAGSPLT